MVMTRRCICLSRQLITKATKPKPVNPFSCPVSTSKLYCCSGEGNLSRVNVFRATGPFRSRRPRCSRYYCDSCYNVLWI